MQKIVGMIFGEVGHGEFNFLVSSTAGLERGDYIKVKHERYGWVLGQVKSIKRYNELYSLNALTGAAEPKEQDERIIARAKVIGYISGEGVLRVPRIPFKPGERVYLADAGIIQRSLRLGNRNGIYIGTLGGRDDIPVFLNPNKLVQKHIAVLAKTGAGKSYTVGVLVEELLEKKVPVVIVDPHGEYSALRYPNDSQKELALMEKYRISPKGYDGVVEYTPSHSINPQADRKLSLDITRLSVTEFVEMLPAKITDTQRGILFEALKAVKSYGRYTIDDIINIVQEHESKAKWNLLTALEMLRESRIFEGTPVRTTDLVRPGICSIINLRGVQPEIQDLVVSRVATEIFEDRKRGKVPPLLFLIEEAHNFAPERGFGTRVCNKVLRTIASEGRKFGMGLCVVTQRPARIDKSVLSQCNTQIILKVTNPNDLRAISQSIEGFTQEMEDEIRQLEPGTALIVGEVVEQPIFVRIRVKRSRHGGAGVEVVHERRRRHRRQEFNSLLKKIFSRYS